MDDRVAIGSRNVYIYTATAVTVIRTYDLAVLIYWRLYARVSSDKA